MKEYPFLVNIVSGWVENGRPWYPQINKIEVRRVSPELLDNQIRVVGEKNGREVTFCLVEEDHAPEEIPSQEFPVTLAEFLVDEEREDIEYLVAIIRTPGQSTELVVYKPPKGSTIVGLAQRRLEVAIQQIQEEANF